MRIQSLIFDGTYHLPIEVELTLWPGLPGIQFFGLPDQHIKESAARIKSAIKSQGFEFPRAKQIYVNLRPNYLKKSSKGLELAVAAAYLMETNQIPIPENKDQFFYFGELDLSGTVYFPNEKLKIRNQDSLQIISAEPSAQSIPISFSRIEKLSDLKNNLNFESKNNQKKYRRPIIDNKLSFSKNLAKLLKICALGKHSLLLAGASGVGKTTFAKSLYQILPDPEESEWSELQSENQESHWRPLIKPHHTTPIMTMIGGGTKIVKGEIARAHLGMLLLDELLEFESAVIEALREPMEEKKMRVVRAGVVQEFPTNCLIVGTTNLCPCGSWTPENGKYLKCIYSAKRCRSTLEKLSGPMLDRFEILNFVDESKKSEVSLQRIFQEIQTAIAFRNERQRMPISDANFEELLPDERGSYRRKLATLGVARTIADLEGSLALHSKHIEEALEYTYYPFQKLVYESI